MLLLEFTPAVIEITGELFDKEKNEKYLKAVGKFSHVDKVNSNGRLYPRALMQREIDRLTPAMEKLAVFGASYHPKDGIGEVNDVSHLWEDCWIERDGSCMGQMILLNTMTGKNTQAIIKAGGRVGLSSRGYGTTTEKEVTVEGKKVKCAVVNEDFVLKTPGDFTLSPSVPDSGIMKLLEQRFENGFDVFDEEVLRERYVFAMRAGFKGSFQDYR